MRPGRNDGKALDNLDENAAEQSDKEKTTGYKSSASISSNGSSQSSIDFGNGTVINTSNTWNPNVSPSSFYSR